MRAQARGVTTQTDNWIGMLCGVPPNVASYFFDCRTSGLDADRSASPLGQTLEHRVMERDYVMSEIAIRLGPVRRMNSVHALKRFDPGRVPDSEHAVGSEPTRGQRMASKRLVVWRPEKMHHAADEPNDGYLLAWRRLATLPRRIEQENNRPIVISQDHRQRRPRFGRRQIFCRFDSVFRADFVHVHSVRITPR